MGNQSDKRKNKMSQGLRVSAVNPIDISVGFQVRGFLSGCLVRIEGITT